MRVASVVLTAATAALLVSGCVHVPPSRRAGPRREAYLRSQRELPPAVADAIRRGHVSIGMDSAQVKAVVGEPLKTTTFRDREGTIEVWLYPAVRFHQGHLHAEGTLFRLVMANGRLAAIESF